MRYWQAKIAAKKKKKNIHTNCTHNVFNFHQVEDGSKHYLRVNSFETNCDPSLELVGQSFVDNVSADDHDRNSKSVLFYIVSPWL